MYQQAAMCIPLPLSLPQSPSPNSHHWMPPPVWSEPPSVASTGSIMKWLLQNWNILTTLSSSRATPKQSGFQGHDGRKGSMYLKINSYIGPPFICQFPLPLNSSFRSSIQLPAVNSHHPPTRNFCLFYKLFFLSYLISIMVVSRCNKLNYSKQWNQSI